MDRYNGSVLMLSALPLLVRAFEVYAVCFRL